MDATCFESYLRYPIGVKLLWESCQWLHQQLIGLCLQLGVRRPRSRFVEQKHKYFVYVRSRKKTYQNTIKRRASLLHLLDKLLKQ